MEEYQEISQDKEINLIDLMFYCLKRWRWIVVCMIFLAAIAGAYKYRTTISENQIKKVEQAKREMTEPVEGETESEPIVFEDPVSSAVTFAIAGMVGGACLVCLVFCMKYVMSGKLQSENDFQEKFGIPLLGVIRRNVKKKRLFGLIDRWIQRLEEGPYAKIPRKEQIKIAAVNVQSAIHREQERKITRVMLAGSTAGDDIVEICEQLAEEIGEITFSPYRQIVFHASALKKLEYYEGVLFIEKKGESYEKLIRQEIGLAVSRGVKVLGSVVC